MARYFDDTTSEYLEIDSSPVSAVPITIAAWAYSDNLSTVEDQIIAYVGDKDAADEMFLLRLDSTGINDLWARHRNFGGTSTATAGTFIVNTWHHCVAVFASNTSRTAYFDGTAGTENTDTRSAVSSDRVAIGRAGDTSPGDYFSGRIAEVGIWNAALTAAEITALSKGYSPQLIRPQSLVFYAQLIRDEDYDKVGGLSLTPFNTPTIAPHPPMIYPAPVYVPTPVGAGAPAGRTTHNTDPYGLGMSIGVSRTFKILA